MQVEGIPDGWYFVRVGKVKLGEFYVNNEGFAREWTTSGESGFANYVVISKIEKPKRYRPFANAAEFEPHRDKWLKLKRGGGDHRIKTYSCNDRKHYTGDDGSTWKEMFDDFEFEDGTPFGVEVTE
jgi:hypothetical protein